LRDCVGHTLHIRPPQIPRGYRADQGLDVPLYASFVDRQGRWPLRSLEPRHDQSGARRFHVGVAKLGDRDSLASSLLLARRVLPLICRVYDLLGTLASLLDSPRPMISDCDKILPSAHPPLNEEALLACATYADPETFEPIIPNDEPTTPRGLQAVNVTLSQPHTLRFSSRHVLLSIALAGQQMVIIGRLSRAIRGNLWER
jgi:hypothetical protein